MAALQTDMDSRELNFVPVDNANPKTLTREQIDFYNEFGYLKPFRIYDDARTAANREYFDWMLETIQQMDDGRDAYSINGYETRCAKLWDIVTDLKILDLVEDIVGPSFVCWGTHFFCKLPGDEKAVPWHQDASYWPFDTSRTVTVWLAIDDADAENAAMQVIAGSHRQGHLEWKDTESLAVLNQEIVNVERLGSPVYLDLKAGEISLHSDMLAHGSTPNRSTRRRCGLTMRYCTTDVKAINPNWARNVILCRGDDPHGHWENRPRPSGEDLSPLRDD